MERKNGLYYFKTFRNLNTNDDKDKLLECGKTYEMAWVASTYTAEFIKHNKKGRF